MWGVLSVLYECKYVQGSQSYMYSSGHCNGICISRLLLLYRRNAKHGEDMKRKEEPMRPKPSGRRRYQSCSWSTSANKSSKAWFRSREMDRWIRVGSLRRARRLGGRWCCRSIDCCCVFDLHGHELLGCA